jgi:predicted enzyme related to lactoylglutathione lyase
MRLPLLLGAAVMAATASLPASSQPAPDISVEKFGLYVVAEDLDRAAFFYTALFNKEPRVRTSGMLGYDVADGFYAVVLKSLYAPNSTQGTSVVPYLHVHNVEAEFERVRMLAPQQLQTQEVVVEGPFRFFRFTDPDNNLIEFFSVGPAP